MMNEIKMVLTGVNGTGKASIIKCLQNQFQHIFLPIMDPDMKNPIMNFFGGNLSVIQPTLKADSVNYELELVDQKVMQEASYLIYVVDLFSEDFIQENQRYFHVLMKYLNFESKNLQIMIFFHKIDDIFTPQLKVEMQLFLRIFMEMLKSHFTPVYHHLTSIFRPYTIFSAFSRPILQNHGFFSPINYILKEFGKQNKLRFLSVLTSNFVQVGFYQSTNPNHSDFFQEINSFLRKSISSLNDLSHFQFKVREYLISVQKFYLQKSKDDKAVFLIWSETPCNHQKLEDHVYELQENLRFFLSGVPDGFLA